MGSGKVWLVGAGPGDPGLLTVKGREVLENAEVVLYDKLVSLGVLCRIPLDAEAIDVGKRAGDHPVPQEEINRILLRKAQEGKRVVRLKGGDPFVFGRGGEELELLAREGIPFEIVPGITSAVAVPAYGGIPVTHRDFCSSFHVITGHTRKGSGPEIDFKALTALGGTLLFLMGLSALPMIQEGLLSAGMPGDTPAAVLEQGTTSRQRKVVSTLDALLHDAKEGGINTPAIVVVGKVCALANHFSWAEKRPLAGIRVFLTRPAGFMSTLYGKLVDLGAEVVEAPAIKTRSLGAAPGIAETLARLKDFPVLAFTSPAGVRYFFEALFLSGLDSRALAGHFIAGVGLATGKALSEKGIRADLIPERFSGAFLGREIAQAKQGPVLLIRAWEAAPGLDEELLREGIPYEALPVYETLCCQSKAVSSRDFFSEENTAGRAFAMFTSASTVRGFLAQEGGAVSGIRAVCIGEQTAREARAAGMRVFVSKEATLDSMVECLLENRLAD